jgi:hypothetical protein
MPDDEIMACLRGTTQPQACTLAEEYFDKATEQLGL